MNEKIREHIEYLYDVFQKYHGNFSMSGSANYGSSINEWNRNLFSKPLRKLTDDDLSRFTGKVITTWGSEWDLKHFLPRILELTAEYNTPYEIWILLDKLVMVDWNNWESREKVSIIKYLDLLLEQIISDDSDICEAAFIDYFTAINYFHPSINRILEIIDLCSSDVKYKHLSNLIVEQSELIFKKGKIDGFQKTDKNVVEIKNWILRKEMTDALSRVYFKYDDENFAEKISWAEQIISFEIKLLDDGSLQNNGY